MSKILFPPDYSNTILGKFIKFGNCSRKQCESILSHFYPLSVTFYVSTKSFRLVSLVMFGGLLALSKLLYWHILQINSCR